MKLTLEEENDFLKERVKQLEDLLTPSEDEVPLEWGMTGAEAKIVGYLRRIAPRLGTQEALLRLLYDDRVAVEPSVLKVFICKIRRKLRNTGFQITTLWGQGYLFAEGEGAFRVQPDSWTEAEDAILRASDSRADAAAKTGRTLSAVIGRASALGHRWGPRRWRSTNLRRQNNAPVNAPNPSNPVETGDFHKPGFANKIS